MHGLPRDTGFGRLVQVLIAQHKVSRAIGIQHQKSLFKTGKITHQVLEIAAVLGVAVYHQLLKAAILHALQHLVKALLNGGIGQHYRLSGAVLGRLRHLSQADIILFHLLHLSLFISCVWHTSPGLWEAFFCYSPASSVF